MLHDIVFKGSTDRSVTLRCLDSTTGAPKTDVAYNSSGIDLWYRREGAALTSVTEATLAALTTAHADGGFLHVANGVYRLDLPDAAFATGANYVDFGGTVTGGHFIGGRVRLIDINLEDTVRAGLTALPNAAAAASGGLFTRGTGAGQINQDANGRIDVNIAAISTDSAAADNLESYTDGTTPIPANMTQVSGDATAADNLETSFDDTAGPVPWMGIVDQGTAQSASSTGVVLRSAAAFADDTLIGCTIGVLGSTQGYWQFREITDNALSGDTVTVDTWTVTPSGTITYKIFGGPPASASLLPPVNVTQWNGSAVATPSVAGVPEVDITHVAGATTDVSALATNVAAILVDTGTTLQGELDGIQADTEDIQSRLPAALVGGRIDATVDGTGMEAGAVSAIQSGLATSAALAVVDGIADNLVSGIIFGAAATGTLSTTQATTNLTGYADDQLIGRVVVWLTGNCEGEATRITDYANTGGLLTFVALTTAPGNGDTFKIV